MEQREEVRLAFLFADICRSTELLVRLGDRRAHQLVCAHRADVRAALGRHRGCEIELRGDGCLAVFADDADALRAALHLGGLPQRIGIHSGTALCDDGKYFGRNVVLAARLCEHAHPREILVSDALRGSVEPVGQFSFGPTRMCALRGFSELQRVHPASALAVSPSTISYRLAADGDGARVGTAVGRLALGVAVSAGG